MTHYIAIFQSEADEFCADRGLDTTERKIAFFREERRRLLVGPKDYRAWIRKAKTRIAQDFRDEVLRSRMPEREPGEDDEALAA